MSATAANPYGRPGPIPNGPMNWGTAPEPGPKLRRLWEAWWAMPKAFRVAAMVLGFIAWWPIGLTLLAATATGKLGRHRHEPRGCTGWTRERAPASSGNHAFDDYREETLRRLEDEQRDFSAFLERLRLAKDKAEFEQFMADRRRPPAPEPQSQA